MLSLPSSQGVEAVLEPCTAPRQTNPRAISGPRVSPYFIILLGFPRNQTDALFLIASSRAIHSENIPPTNPRICGGFNIQGASQTARKTKTCRAPSARNGELGPRLGTWYLLVPGAVLRNPSRTLSCIHAGSLPENHSCRRRQLRVQHLILYGDESLNQESEIPSKIKMQTKKSQTMKATKTVRKCTNVT